MLSSTQPHNRLIVWGTGELGGRVARLWRETNGPVIGLTQSDRRHADLQADGITPEIGDPVELLQPEDALLFSLPGHATQHEAVQHLIDQGVAAPERAVLVSTTGYYGPDVSGPITEETPPGDDDRSASIAAAEQTFMKWAGEAGVVVRLSGLYSKNRGPMSALAKRGAPKRFLPPDKTLALIHYDDAATALFAALKHPSPAGVYLAVSPPCPTRAEFYVRACRILDLPAPEFAAPTGRPPADYRVDRLRRDLLPMPAYPDWQAALQR